LAVRAHLEAALGRDEAERRRVPGGTVPRDAAAVEAARHVREVERADEPLRDARALQRHERRVARNGLEPVAILEPAGAEREAVERSRTRPAPHRVGHIPPPGGVKAISATVRRCASGRWCATVGKGTEAATSRCKAARGCARGGKAMATRMDVEVVEVPIG